ncbi:low-density lipoprotein receptor-related protein 2 [Caerostris darwini]|uniref:Low-density lipoprotein receptor-related protein 2 n=1 Tax=Caerostris darwini TaxID=1538125 RepID=A0AAV4UFT8_9ARAC|nr:low-density lipoprotein receptor-related protein 2 [Caerostris darwini]
MNRIEKIFGILLIGDLVTYTEAIGKCPPGHFECFNGKCIKRGWFCDEGNDCEDNSDERYCNIGRPDICPIGWKKCQNEIRCIPAHWMCDNITDCQDRSDEKNCVYGECSGDFKCFNDKCIKRGRFCDNTNDCGDNSDERYCNVDSRDGCPTGWKKCLNEIQCIPAHWMCDNITDCQDQSDEKNCGNEVLRIPGVVTARLALIRWFLQRRLNSTTSKWGPQLNRIAVALHLAEDGVFALESNIRQEMTYELTIKLLNKLNNERLNAEELALYVHALLVTCVDVRDFYGRDLVKELRVKVEETRNYTNPFLMLVLCNAGDAMTVKDVEEVVAAFNSPKKIPWTDVQALATMALACLSSRQNVPVDEDVLEDMLGQLKRQQFSNGSLDNFRTTALVVQALLIHHSYKTNFDLTSAIKILMNSQEMESSLLNAYYVLPVLSNKSLLNVTSAHCPRETKTGNIIFKAF